MPSDFFDLLDERDHRSHVPASTEWWFGAIWTVVLIGGVIAMVMLP